MAPGRAQEALQRLGMSLDDARCYVALSRLGRAPAGTVAKQVAMSRPQVYQALRELVGLGFAHASTGRPTLFEAAPIAVVLGHYESAAKSTLSDVARLSQELHPLLAPDAAPPPAAEHDIDVVARRHNILMRLRNAIMATRTSIDALINHPPAIHLLKASGNLDRMLEKAQQGVRIRLVLGRAVDRTPDLEGYARQGIDFAITQTRQAMGFYQFDRRETMIWIRSDRSADVARGSSVAIHSLSREVADLFSTLFEAQWSRSAPLYLRPAGSRRDAAEGRHRSS